MSLTLTVIDGPHAGRAFTFHGHDTFLVGRSPDAHFSLPDRDRYFSRIHFLIEVNPPLCRLLDLKSHNGTYVNGRRVETADLAPGDLIRAGHTVLRVSLDAAGGPAGPSAPTPVAAAAPHEPTRPPSAGPEDLLDQAAARQEEAWATGHPLSVEQLLQQYPALAADPEAVVELVCAEAEFRRRAGQKVQVSEYQQRFPHLAGPIGLGLLPEAPDDSPGAAASLSEQTLPTIPGYRVEALLGYGGMGVVYRAVREGDGLDVALKIIRPAVAQGSAAVGRFLREAKVLAELHHPHIVKFLAMGETAGLLHFAMEYVPGTDAARLVQAGGPLAPGRAVRLLLPVLDGLAYAHSRGFVHRDIKPANLLVTEAGGRELAKLADFGLARTYQTSQMSGLTMADASGGTPAFMPPEQLRDFRGAQPPADQYAAAATLDYLLTGKVLFETDSAPEWFKRLLLEEPNPHSAARPDVPAGLAAALRRALRPRPEQRFPDVTALRDALRPFATP
jgi:serine/threonine-protein kinase